MRCETIEAYKYNRYLLKTKSLKNSLSHYKNCIPNND